MIHLYFDGGTTGSNPGPMITGYVLKDESGIIDCVRDDYAETSTNNEAEYCGLISGLLRCFDLGFKKVTVIGDSQLVINQVTKKWKVKAHNMLPLFGEVQLILRYFDEVRFEWVKRDQNLAGIFLEHGKI